MTQTQSAVLLQQSALLAESFAQLATQLTLTAQGMQDPGTPPPEALLEGLVASRRGFTDLCSRVLALAQSLSVVPLPEREAIASLTDLKSLLWTVTQAEEQKAVAENRRQQAVQILDQVLAIVHRDHIVFPPLLDCKEKASELRQALSAIQWPDSHPALDALAEGKHPFLPLLTLIEAQEELDDDQWATLQDTIEQEFGRPLAVAASRGKLHISPESPSESIQAPPPPVAAGSVPVITDGHHAGTSPAPESSYEGWAMPSPDASAQEVSTEGEVAVLEVPESNGTVEEWVVEETVTVLPAEEPETATNGLAPETPSIPEIDGASIAPDSMVEEESGVQTHQVVEPEGQNDERLSTVRSLMWQLIAEDKSKLAFHIAGYLETQHPELQPHIPSWLIRSVALARLLRHANGEIARLIKEDFAQFSPKAIQSGEWKHAAQFLPVAATLQPALLAPHTGASAVLRAVHLPEEMGQLTRICHLVAEYGETGEPLDPKSLRKGKDQAVWQTSMDELKKHVEVWCARTLTAAMLHPPATKVWKKWQEPRGVLHSLLSPIRQSDPKGLALVKRTVEQFSDDAQIKREVERTDREVLGRRLGDDITGRTLEQIRRHTKEALGFAQRWIELQENRVGQSNGTRNEQIELLRQEVWSRHTFVFEELNNFKRRHPSLPIVGSIASCQRAFDNIKTLFDPQASFPAEEPLPKPLLYADLLRIPAVTLNDQWKPENTDPEALIDGILELVTNRS